LGNSGTEKRYFLDCHLLTVVTYMFKDSRTCEQVPDTNQDNKTTINITVTLNLYLLQINGFYRPGKLLYEAMK
jgi:hypothetical protein